MLVLQPESDILSRGRFAPTPSGHMHVGNAMAALLSWLQLRSQGGAFVLRMEDVDTGRSRQHFADSIVHDLTWLGLNWDEGPDAGGHAGPYVQSQRLELYREALDKLQAQGLLYSCYCSRADILAAPSAPHGLSAEGPLYPGTCRHLSQSEQQLKARTKTPSLRFKVKERFPGFQDGILGPIEVNGYASSDFVVRRADGIYAYQLAVVVDDAAMGITDVFRGADLLDSTPRQLMLYEALELTPPRFAHFPLLLDEKGNRLAKRTQGLSIRELRQRGVNPRRIVGWLAWITGLIGSLQELSPQELIPLFSMERVPKEPVMLTPDVLNLL
ncbi:tRNA glutamyl-Q(34) synthetase GluQRS [Paenibacillus sp. F411]|nr:tRNA glutamyl-Q(34) synthetase GluQRS [Paenibacillus sp. F411]